MAQKEELGCLYQMVYDYYLARGVIRPNTGRELIHGQDAVHIFYTLSENGQGIHIEGILYRSNLHQAHLRARGGICESNYFHLYQKNMLSIPQSYFLGLIYPNFGLGVDIPYDPKILERMLEENCPQLKR